MSLMLGLVAFALAGQEGPPSPPSDVAPIAFRIRFVEMNGLDWRGALHSRLQPVARKGLASVWTAEREVVGDLAKHVDHVVAAPQIATVPMSDATVLNRRTRRYVGHLTRHSDGPIDHATRVSYEPQVEDIHEGELATLSGRKLDQGVLTCLVIDDTFITAVHTVSLSESLEKSSMKGAHPATLTTQIQVPEVAEAKVEGEWLIPNDHVLIVSLGAHTIADADGKAVVRERLVVIDADPPKETTSLADLPPLPPEPAPATPDVIAMSMAAARTVADLLASVHPADVQPMPAMPSRCLPQPIDSEGRHVEVPAGQDSTPEDLPDVASFESLDVSAEPRPSPQARHCPAVATTDPSTAQTAYEAGVKAGKWVGNSCPKLSDAGQVETATVPSCRRHLPEAAEAKVFTFRIPISETSSVQIRATATRVLTNDPTGSAD